jgi:hypothetical protein
LLTKYQSNSFLYQFQKLGDDDNEPEYGSTLYPSFGMADPSAPLPHAFFRPRPLENLVIADELVSLDPILDSKVMNLLPNHRYLLHVGEVPVVRSGLCVMAWKWKNL